MDFKQQIAKMTLEEKCSLLSGGGQFYTKEVARLGIPAMFLSDGPHGVRKQAGSADHLGLNESLPATCYPCAATMANSWDVELAEQIGQCLGEESAAQGVNVLLGPGLNMKRSPLGGRNFEYFSEDPYLAGKFAAAYIRGIQAKGVAACPKHFAVNNQELRRMHNDSVVDERALREVYLTGFEIAVKEGKPLSLMSAYNRVNGVYANEEESLLQKTLRDEWGFDGFVVTDWGGSNDRVAGLVAGNHLEMPGTQGQSDMEVIEAVRSNKLSEAVVDKRVEEYLKVLFATLLPKGEQQFDVEKNHQFARKAAESAIVLLKNEDGILPLAEKTKVAVIGDFAKVPRYQGAGSSQVNATKADNPLECLQTCASLEVVGYQQGFARFGKPDEALSQSAVELAKQAEVVLFYMGLDELSESEGIDRQHMRLGENQVTLLEQIAKVNPNIVVVLCGASAVETPWLESCKGLVHGYLGGQAGASAMVDVLVGKVNPSGKLSESWPLTCEDNPSFPYFPGAERTAEYRESIYIGYRYYDTAGVPVRFPFGFGLSYTSFEYSDIIATEKEITFTVKNTGQAAGAEVAQLYIGKQESALFRAKHELKGFTKVFLNAGEEKRISISLDDKAFRYYDVAMGSFQKEAGMYTVEIGASSRDIRLSAQVEVEGTAQPQDKRGEIPCYYNAAIKAVPNEEFEKLLGRPIPKKEWDRTLPLDRNDTFSQLFYAKGWVGRLVYKILTSLKLKAEKKGKPDLNILFIYNMPFRGVAKMMGGAADIAMVDGLLAIFNGHFFKGVGRLVAAWVRKSKAARQYRKKLEESSADGQ